MDQTEGNELLQQTACRVGQGQAGEHEIRVDVALHEVWSGERKERSSQREWKIK